MKHEIYSNLSITDDFSIFEFLSVGPKGIIPKRIEFMPTGYKDVFNLAFGDISNDGELNDVSISGNDDRDKILSTIAYAVDIYLSRYPQRWIYFKGSTPARIRLYRMAIGINFQELTKKYVIYSQIEDGIVRFQKNKPIIGLLIKRKA
jgi:hypothetical protein